MQKSDKKVVSLFEKTNPGFQKITLTDSLRLKRGGYLKNPVLAYETWGELSINNDNLISTNKENDLKKFSLILNKYKTFSELLRKILDEC